AASAGAVAGFKNSYLNVAIVGEQLVCGGQPADPGPDDHNVLSVEAVLRDHARIVGDLHPLVRGAVKRRPGTRRTVVCEIFATTLVHWGLLSFFGLLK